MKLSNLPENMNGILACPICHSALEIIAPDRLCCPEDQQEFVCVDGIWRFLPAERLAFYHRFINDYEAIRRAEERGSDDPAYYRALPFEDLTGKHMAAWHIRATSYNTFIKHVITPLEQARQRPLTILDIGAGNGWLSYRLSTRGHIVAAIDLLTNRFDGLGARSFYDRSFPALQAEFDHLPLLDGAADVVVYNASFHYSTNYEQTLSEAGRVLQNNGIATIIDSPIYQSGDSGRQMVLERKAQFSKDFGRAGDALSSENYLTYARLDQLAHSEGLTWRFVWPVPAWRRRIRQWRSRWSGRREPAQFPVLLAQWSFNN